MTARGRALARAVFEARAHDHPDVERAVTSWLAGHLSAGVDAGSRQERAAAYEAMHEWTLLRAIADSMLAPAPADPSALTFRAIAAARSGDRGTADALRARLDSLAVAARRSPAYPRNGRAISELTRLRAAVAGAVGDLAGATALIRSLPEEEGQSELYHDTIVYEELREYPPFQALLAPKG